MRRYALFLVLSFLVPLPTYAFSIPEPNGFVTDIAGVLSLGELQTIEAELSAYQAETSNEIAVLLIPSVEGEDIAQLATDIGRQWGVGSAKNDNGILLLIAIEDRQLFIATGYGLEGAVPDIAAKYIIDTEITPAFKNGNFAEGILNGIAALKQQIGGEYSIESSDIDDALSLIKWILSAIMMTAVLQFFLAFIVNISVTRSWMMGAIIGGIAGYVAGGFLGLVLVALFGGIFDYIVSMLYIKSPGFQTFVKGVKKHQKAHPGLWGGGKKGGGGSRFGGGSFGGGGAGGGW